MPRYRTFVLAALLVGCATGAPIATGPTGEPPRAYRARTDERRHHSGRPHVAAVHPFADDSMLGREVGHASAT